MKKIYIFLLLLIPLLILTGCEEKKEEGSAMSKTEQDLTIIEKDDTGEITKGTIEGFTFEETEEVTDRVKIQMENGDVILIVLYNSKTPITIANFQNLVKEKFYDGLIFHRVILDFMIQTGDPTGTGFHGSDTTIKGEFSENGVYNDLSHTRGVVSMARTSGDNNSASSQFFICQRDVQSLDGGYASFAKVFAGMDAVDTIANVETDSNDKPLVEQKIKSIRFITIVED